MVSTRSTTFRVGAVMLAGIAVLMTVVVLAGRKTRVFTSTVTFQAHFHRVNGLQAGAPVALSGVTIGAVDSIAFPSDPRADYIIVKMWVDKAAAQRVRADSHAQIETLGLLGDKFVELTPGSPQAPLAPPGAVLEARDPLDYEALVGRQDTRDFLANLYFIAGSMRAILAELQSGHGLLSELIRGDESGAGMSLADLKHTLDHIDHTTQSLDKLLSQLMHGRSLASAAFSNQSNGPKIMSDLAASIASLRVTADRLDNLTARMERARGLIPRLAEDPVLADRIIGDLEQISQELKRVLYKIDSGQGTLGKMINDPTLYDRLDSVFSGGGWGLSFMRAFYSLSHPFTASSDTSRGTTASCQGAPNTVVGGQSGGDSRSGVGPDLRPSP